MLLDAHAHLDMYDADTLDEILLEITANKIFTISNSMDIASFKRNLEISKMSNLIMPSFGIHPWKASQYVKNLDSLVDYIIQSPILGEIGLDFYFVNEKSQISDQLEVFEFFLTASKELRKTINVHSKGAEKEILNLVNRFDLKQMIIHWYSGPLNILSHLIDRGAYFTVGIEILHSKHIRNIARRIPLDKLLTETDNPGGANWLTGQTGTPRLLLSVLNSLADIKRIDPAELNVRVLENFTKLAKLDDDLFSSWKKQLTSVQKDSVNK